MVPGCFQIRQSMQQTKDAERCGSCTFCLGSDKFREWPCNLAHLKPAALKAISNILFFVLNCTGLRQTPALETQMLDIWAEVDPKLIKN